MSITASFKKVATLALAGLMTLSLFGCNTGASGGSAPANASGELQQSQQPQNTKPIVVVWYPNESANDRAASREAFGKVIEEATGRKVEHKLTTDYVIAIESLASGSADIGASMGAVGYIEAKTKNPEVNTLVVNSDSNGTLDNAIYYSWLAVNSADDGNYKTGDSYSIENIQGKRASFVSNSSTSGFKVPTTSIIDYFKQKDQWKDINTDALVEGGQNMFFSEVLFGGSHQGSAFNLVSGKADVAAFCDTELIHYVDVKTGELNKVGTVYAVKSDASAPFDTVTGKEFTVISVTPVLNGPCAYNPKNLSPDEVKKIQDALTSEATANIPELFYNADNGEMGFYKKTDKEAFVVVEDSWYDPIRTLG